MQHAAADAVAGEGDTDEIGDYRRGVEDGDAGIVGFAGANRARMGKGHRKFRIAHQHTALGAALDGHRPRRQAVKHGREIEVHLVQAFLQTLHQKLGLPNGARLQAVNVIRRTHQTVGPHLAHRQNVRYHRGLPHPRKAQRIIPWCLPSARHLVGPRRQHQLGLHPVHTQTRVLRCPVLRENHHIEKLIQKSDVAGNDHQRGNRRNLQPQVILRTLVNRLKIQALDLDIRLRRAQALRHLHRRHQLPVDALRLQQARFQLRRRYHLRGLPKRRRHHRKFHRHHRPVNHKSHLKLNCPEVVLVNHNPLVRNLTRTQCPRFHPRY